MKIAKTADRKKVMDTSKSTACPKCGKDTRIVKRVKDRERGVPGGVYISCSGCEFFEKLSGTAVSSQPPALSQSRSTLSLFNGLRLWLNPAIDRTEQRR